MKGEQGIKTHEKFSNFLLFLKARKGNRKIDQDVLIKVFYCSSRCFFRNVIHEKRSFQKLIEIFSIHLVVDYFYVENSGI